MINSVLRGISIVIIALLISLFSQTIVYSGQKYTSPIPKGINKNVQLKENGWIKITEESYWEETWGERDKRIGIGGHQLPPTLANKIFRNITVTIQFLKKCNAISIRDEWKMEMDEKYKDYKPNDKINVLEMFEGEKGGMAAAWFAVNKLMSEGKTEEALKLHDESEKKYPDFMRFDLPLFKSDYHTKVFVTFFSKDGFKIKELSEYPIAYWVDGEQKQRKTEMLPGETTYFDFSVPDGGTKWYVWVPK